MSRTAISLALIALFCAACAKPILTGRVSPDVRFVSQDFAANPNDLYYAVRWALKEAGYPVDNEDLPGGVITTKWTPVTVDSHYMEVFGQKDYGVTNSYHQLEVRIVPQAGRSLVEVGSRVKTIAHGLKSSGTEERRVLACVGDYLRSGEPNLTNLGITE
ncbi:MAG: hypothetical protein JXA24_06150 [Proteobacteria bacterium]|nr:hypothetical protein [Pseudomonadota bacterium]